MKNFGKKVMALSLCVTLASMQFAFADIATGLNNAVIGDTVGGFKGVTTGVNSATLNFDADSHVKWNTLNVNSNETLNFNALDKTSNLTILNTVDKGMSNFAGAVNASEGIGKLIISNPNGVLFNGVKFTTAGDTMITTQPLNSTFTNGTIDVVKAAANGNLGFITIKDSDLSAGGEFKIMAPSIETISSTMKAGNGIRLITANGQDYLSAPNTDVKSAVRLEAVVMDGDVYIVSDKGVVKTVTGGDFKGDLEIISNDSVALNYVANGKALNIDGNVNAKANGPLMYARNAKVGGNLAMKNTGGFVDVGNVKVGGNANLTTEGFPGTKNDCCSDEYNHFVHVVGNTSVGGDLNIEASQNIHIGGYNYDAQKLMDGKLTVGGDLNAHSTDGHITTTIDTTANKISMKSDKLNILTDGEATLTANEYKFSSNGYIGGIIDTEKYTNDQQIVAIMENYKYISDNTKSGYVNIAGGDVKEITAPKKSAVYISSNGDMNVSGVNAGTVNLTSYGNDIKITGPNVHADNINVGPETDTLTVDFPSRDYTLKYTNIRDAKEVVIKGNEEITYELTNGDNGYNINNPRPEKTTYLTGPNKPVEKPDEPIVEPDDPVVPPSTPDKFPDGNENIKILKNLDKDMLSSAVNANPVYTPIAYAADLDDDKNKSPIRKNVDGSVTIVRAQPMLN